MCGCGRTDRAASSGRDRGRRAVGRRGEHAWRGRHPRAVVEEELGDVELIGERRRGRGAERGGEAGRGAASVGEVRGHGGGVARRRRVVVQHWARADCRHDRPDHRRGSFVFIAVAARARRVGELPVCMGSEGMPTAGGFVAAAGGGGDACVGFGGIRPASR